MHWSPGFHKADLVGLEMAKKKKLIIIIIIKYLIVELLLNRKSNYKNRPLKLIHLLG